MSVFSKRINKPFNNTFLVLILLILNFAIQTTFQKTNFKKENNSLKNKSLNRITIDEDLEDGTSCNKHTQCKSGFCGYNGPILSSRPENYDSFACMQKHSKPKDAACSNHNECNLHTGGRFDFARCKKSFNMDLKRDELKCE